MVTAEQLHLHKQIPTDLSIVKSEGDRKTSTQFCEQLLCSLRLHPSMLCLGAPLLLADSVPAESKFRAKFLRYSLCCCWAGSGTSRNQHPHGKQADRKHPQKLSEGKTAQILFSSSVKSRHCANPAVHRT